MPSREFSSSPVYPVAEAAGLVGRPEPYYMTLALTACLALGALISWRRYR
jgi:hypothetical protein